MKLVKSELGELLTKLPKSQKIAKVPEGVLTAGKIFDLYIFNLFCKSSNFERKISFWKKNVQKNPKSFCFPKKNSS